MSNRWSTPGNEDPGNLREMTDMERLALVEQIRILHPRLRSLLERLDPRDTQRDASKQAEK